jgi:YD repeat-containing protein
MNRHTRSRRRSTAKPFPAYEQLHIEQLESRAYLGSTLDILGYALYGSSLAFLTLDRMAAAWASRRAGAGAVASTPTAPASHANLGTGDVSLVRQPLPLPPPQQINSGLTIPYHLGETAPGDAAKNTDFLADLMALDPERPRPPLPWRADAGVGIKPTVQDESGSGSRADAAFFPPPAPVAEPSHTGNGQDYSWLPFARPAETAGSAGAAVAPPASANTPAAPASDSTDTPDNGWDLTDTQATGTLTRVTNWSTVAAAQHTRNQQTLAFEPNLGQTDPQVQYLARGPGYTLFLTPTEAVFAFPFGTPAATTAPATFGKPGFAEARPTATSIYSVRMQLAGANAAAETTGLDRLPGRSNYFLGNDPSKWATDVPHYASVAYHDIYPGVDMAYYGVADGKLEYDFVVNPQADPGTIRMTFQGATDVRVDNQGNLVVDTPAGELVEHAPVIYQDGTGGRRTVAGRYVMRAPDQAGFSVSGYDAGRPLVIDPALTYSSYLGGSNQDVGLGIAVDAGGDVYITGRTSSTDFPTTPGATTWPGINCAFVTKMDPSGSTLFYSTYLGGHTQVPGYDSFFATVGTGIAVDAANNAYVGGFTTTTDFPTTPGAFQTSPAGGFVTKLGPTGAVAYSTYLGGGLVGSGALEELWGIAVDAAGEAYVTGVTSSRNFPITAGTAYQTVNRSIFGRPPANALVSVLNATGSGLVYSTYLGGTGFDAGWGIAVDAAGNAYVTGSHGADDFPTTPGAFEPTTGGAFVAKVNPTLSGEPSLVYSTHLGGTGNADDGRGIAVDGSGNAYVTGQTYSTDFPTTLHAVQTMYQGGLDAFVTKLNATGTAPIYSTYLGGSMADSGAGDDQGFGIAVDASGNAYVTGETNSTNFPTVNPLQSALQGNSSDDAFVSKLNAGGTALFYSTYLGGHLNYHTDYGSAIAVDYAGSAYITGYASSTDFPTTPWAFQTAARGSGDAFVTKIGDPSLLQRLNDTNSYWLDAGTAQVAPNTGTLRLSNPLDFRQSPDSAQDDSAGLGVAPALVYNSDRVGVRPIAEVTPQFDPSLGIPASIHVDISWSGETQGMGEDFATDGHNPGDTYLLAIQLPATPMMTSTGLYPWQVTVTGHFTSQDVTFSYSGYAQVVVSDSTDTTSRDDSAFGPGWSLAGLNRLVTTTQGPPGVLMVYGDGTASHFFARIPGTLNFFSPLNNFGTLTFDGTIYTYTSKDQVKWKYDNTGLLLSITDPHNLAVTFAYQDSAGRMLKTVQMPDGGVTTFLYNSGSGLLSEIDEPGGRTLTVGRNGSDLTSITNPDGSVHTFIYDTQHRVTQEMWNPVSASYTYDQGTALLSAVNRGQGVTLSVSPVNAQGLTTPALSAGQAIGSTRDGLGHTTSYTLDALGRITQLQRPGVATPETWGRDLAGQVVIHTDGDGNFTLNRYSYGAGRGDLVYSSYSDGSNDLYQYDPVFHHLTVRQDPNFHVTSYAYDNNTGDLLTVTDPLNHVTSYTWSSGLLQTVQDPNTHITSYGYDTAKRRLTTVTDPRTFSTNYQYDDAGNVTKTTDARGNVTTTIYDKMRRLVQQTNADMGALTYTYNGLGEMTSRQDPLGTTTYGYDSHGWQTQVKSARGFSTTSVYDAAGNVTKVIDPRLDSMNNPLFTTIYSYDAANRRTQVTDAAGNNTGYFYDAADNLTKVLDGNTHATTYGYDGRNRRTSVSGALGNTTNTVYDLAGNVTMVVDPNMHHVLPIRCRGPPDQGARRRRRHNQLRLRQRRELDPGDRTASQPRPTHDAGALQHHV